MANPVMNSQNFQQQMQGGGQAQPGWYQGGTQSAQSPYGQQDPSGRAQAFGAGQAAQQYAHQQSMEDAFRAPSAGPEQTGRMTFNDVVGKTGLMLVLVVVAGAVGWFSPGLMIIGAIAVLLAAYSLTMDFEMAAVGVKNGAPQKYSWSVAFGLTVTLIWLYIEILRIVAILRGND